MKPPLLANSISGVLDPDENPLPPVTISSSSLPSGTLENEPPPLPMSHSIGKSTSPPLYSQPPHQKVAGSFKPHTQKEPSKGYLFLLFI